MRWSQDHEDSLQVIAKIFARQLGLPENITVFTDIYWWQQLYPQEKTDVASVTGLTSIHNKHVLINVDKCSNFYDAVSAIAHELWHIRRPTTTNEYKINRLAEKWLNCNLYDHIPDMRQV